MNTKLLQLYRSSFHESHAAFLIATKATPERARRRGWGRGMAIKSGSFPYHRTVKIISCLTDGTNHLSDAQVLPRFAWKTVRTELNINTCICDIKLYIFCLHKIKLNFKKKRLLLVLLLGSRLGWVDVTITKPSLVYGQKLREEREAIGRHVADVDLTRAAILHATGQKMLAATKQDPSHRWLRRRKILNIWNILFKKIMIFYI